MFRVGFEPMHSEPLVAQNKRSYPLGHGYIYIFFFFYDQSLFLPWNELYWISLNKFIWFIIIKITKFVCRPYFCLKMFNILMLMPIQHNSQMDIQYCHNVATVPTTLSHSLK